MEEDAVPEENIAPGGFAYDAEHGLLYLLCGYFGEAVLLGYRFDAAERAFARVFRRVVLNDHEPAGLCLNPGAPGVTGSFQVQILLLDLWGRPITNLDQAREAARAHQGCGAVPMPRTARLGCLGVFSDGGQEWLNLDSEIERDFTCELAQLQSDDGTLLHYGYRLAAGTWEGGDFMTRPVYLDERRVVVGTPNGFLLLVDRVTRETTVAHDLKVTINGLVYCPHQGVLLAGCENGTLTTFAV
jgi:hypothetical protein